MILQTHLQRGHKKALDYNKKLEIKFGLARKITEVSVRFTTVKVQKSPGTDGLYIKIVQNVQRTDNSKNPRSMWSDKDDN